MVPLITLSLLCTLASYQLAHKKEVTLRNMVKEAERAHVVRLISQ